MRSVSQVVFKTIDFVAYPFQNGLSFPNLELVRDLPYRYGGAMTVGDLYFDKTLTAKGGKLPVIVYFHGGGLVMGDKANRRTFCEYLAHNGCLVFNVNFRMPPAVDYRGMVNDCIDAVNYVRTLAREYPIDLAKLVVAGDSSGGYLTAFVAAAAADPTLGLHAVDVPLAAAALFCGIFDLQALTYTRMPAPLVRDSISMLLGTRVEKDLSKLTQAQFDRISPYSLVNENWCPVYIMWSDSDMLCVGQGARMAEKLQTVCRSVVTAHCNGLTRNHCYQLMYRTSAARQAMASFVRYLKNRKIL